MGQRVPGEGQAAPEQDSGQDQFGQLVNGVIESIGIVVSLVEQAGGDPSGLGAVAQAFQQEVTKFAEQAGGAPQQGGQIPANPSQGVPLGPQG
jgi:hypothetical protein